VQLTISSVLENGRNLKIPNLSISKKYKSAVYLTLYGWLLGLFSFNNVYKGVFTSDELIQSPVTSKWEKFCELENFSFVSPANYEMDYTTKGQAGEKLAITETYFGSAAFFTFFSSQVGKGRFNSTLCPINVHGTDLQSHSLLLNNNEGFFQFISSCNRTAFADVIYRIDNFLSYFNSIPEAKEKNLHFVKGKDSILHFEYGYMFHR